MAGCMSLGYFFGNIPIVKDNFEKAIFLIIFLSILPILIEFVKHRVASKKAVRKK